MSIIALLITISLTIALLFLGIFLWTMKSGQYDDMYTPSVRILFDDKLLPSESFDSKKKMKVSRRKLLARRDKK